MIDSTEGNPGRQLRRWLAVVAALAMSTAGCASGLRTSPDNYPGMAYERYPTDGHILLYDLSPSDASARFIVAVYPNNSTDYQVDIEAAGTSRGSHHPLSAQAAVDYARRMREWLAGSDRRQIYSGWRTYEEYETRIVLADLPFGDNLVAFHFNTRNTSDETDSWQYIMHVHQRYIAGMAQALEVAANMVDGTN